MRVGPPWGQAQAGQPAREQALGTARGRGALGLHEHRRLRLLGNRLKSWEIS